MFEVKTQLFHEGELALYAQFAEILLRNRKIQYGTATAEDTAPREAAPAPAPEPVNIAEPSPIAGVIGAEGRVDVISDAKLIDAFQAYAKTKPFAELAALVESYGAKKVAEIPQDKRAAFLAQIGAQ